ncbi:bifunctional aldolase/short-chain dehydrogenase [Saccharothrix australiensis]|uniref:Rhamnose utilization protein RhaD (Predicted bifunctional aldolase and dehydrogenase) n=1 Tax=Saccharothrix australiensis TaxID=2072 RepID=A0A495VWK9_9PSEU|nr:bifunctional aldolase/short-chain dehydrogenase [Saccharothrix australiensis]RKT53791.1 rhamnose utilization protein RhaD (predicted bifunctional aldolase and dehydrogenase) [Saccharothrix australiensis]
MENRWAETHTDPLDACVYGSRLLGGDPDLVLHGGGNTSVKVTTADLTGRPVDVLYVKGSGWDLADIERAGFAPLRLERLRELLTLPSLPDGRMMNELRCALLDASAPDPSVETLLHALLPQPAALHSHADAVITLTNLREPRVAEVFGDRVVVVPYVMPGFALARTCAELFARHADGDTVGVVLMNHGLFTFGEDTEQAYARHVELVGEAEEFLARHRPARAASAAALPPVDPLVLARLRREIADVAGHPVIAGRHTDAATAAFVARPDLADVAGRGPATPDHVIRTKRVPLVGRDVAGYAEDYRRYFAEHARPGLTMLDPAPRVLLDPELGMVTVGRRAKDADIARDIYAHTIGVIERAEALGGYRALPAADLFDVEYWELEQAKLRRGGAPAEFTGEVALVTGAASGIGRACVDALRARGASVVGLDLTPTPSRADYLGLQVDVTDAAAVRAALGRGVERFGGVDVLVACAGVFPGDAPIADLDQETWRRTMSVNVDSVATLLGAAHPLLRLAPRGGRVVVVASKNVPAPGPGAAAYSASKAALTQLARVAALEWAADGIRVNTVHPDAVFDTGLWTDEVLSRRALRYGLDVEAYKRRNLLGAKITSAAVGRLVAELCSDTFACTTGAQVPIDGGNERVV